MVLRNINRAFQNSNDRLLAFSTLTVVADETSAL